MLLEDDDSTGPDAGPGEAVPSGDDTGQTKALRYADADFLKMVRDERQRSVGFGDGDRGILAKGRIRAQEYRQGIIRDLSTITGRSAAVDSTLSDAVDTIMPDVMEQFFGGDDVVTFDADGPGDEDQAREESDVLRQVVFGQNDAFRAFHDAIQDALLNKTGLWHWWWEEDKKVAGQITADDPMQAAAIATMVGQKTPWAQASWQTNDDGSIFMEFAELKGRVVFKAVPSEDFTVAADTVALRDSAYCALRDRPRVQDLIQRGVDKAKARALPHYTTHENEMSRARDEAGEDDKASEQGIDDLRVVEVRAHYLRVDADDDGDVEIWRVETDSEETVLLQKERVTQIPFGALTPYLSAHRFYGESLYDKLQEVQRIKTVLLRLMLDSGYFALNQRFEVAENQTNEFTISDLLNNAPNVPVRSKTGQSLRPLQAGALSFDAFSALEFMAGVAEQRSGVVRNAQGLNPDSLHDTATGAMQLIAAAQKRVRMICRVFAETGVKDLFLGIHQMLREQTTDQHAPLRKKVGRDWKEVRPDTWPERDALTVHVGVGSADRGHDLAVQGEAIELTKEIVQLQGGVSGPFVTPANIYARLKAYSRACGDKDASLYWTDPTPSPGAPPAPPAPPPPSPEAIKAQAEAQAHQTKAQSEAQLGQAKLQSEAALSQAKAQTEAELEQQKIAARAQADQVRNANELRLAQMKLQGELRIAREKMQLEMQLQRDKAAQAIDLQRQEMLATIELQRQKLTMGAGAATNVGDAVTALPGGDG